MVKYNRPSKLLIGFAILVLIIFLSITFYRFTNYCLFKKRYIFIDGGAHIGETIAHFEKSKLYQKHHWEIFSFEANPNLIDLIPKKPNLTVLSKAIWTSDKGVEFYLAEATISSSILNNKKTGGLSKIPILVESVDFGQWLKKNFNQKDYILVKLDIEGAEYQVLDKMLADRTIKYIDELFVEFHNIRVDVPIEKDNKLLSEFRKLAIPVKISNKKDEGDWFD